MKKGYTKIGYKVTHCSVYLGDRVHNLVVKYCHGQEIKWKMEDVHQLHRSQQGMPKRCLSLTHYKPTSGQGGMASPTQLSGCVFRVQPNSNAPLRLRVFKFKPIQNENRNH